MRRRMALSEQGKTIGVVLLPQDRNAVAFQAEAEGLSMSAWCRIAVLRYLAEKSSASTPQQSQNGTSGS